MSDTEKIIYTALLSTIGSAVVAFIVNRLSSDAKTKEIKLSSYHKDRIESVKTLYGLVVELNFANTILFKANGREWGHEAYKSALKRWLSTFNNTATYYNKNRILLLEKSELSNKVRSNLAQLSVLRKVVDTEHNYLDGIEEQFGGQLVLFQFNG
jgi:hypothetical protein